ncbi:unnamed protein product [Paramecium sonneborni]|uniref:Transmembrane protein n=1 Tax=Paramecium sonneborni TaxID=65129 RepID=A0A8S1RM02_9CILI|nr:unnamed protein product [Paramecium sonneborni]
MKIMLKNYFQQTQDIRLSPNNKCNHYAFLPIIDVVKNSLVNHASQIDLINNIYHMINYSFLFTINETKNEIFSSLFEFIYTQECSNCDSKILKNGGCNFTTWKKCKQVFISFSIFNILIDIIFLVLNFRFFGNIYELFINFNVSQEQKFLI